MAKKNVGLFIGLVVVLLVFFLVLVRACASSSYTEDFSDAGNWAAGDDGYAVGSVKDGVYELAVKSDVDMFWTTAGENFGDGIYSVEAAQVGGPIDAGFGMLFRVDDDSDSYYRFAITADGLARADYCANQCAEETILIDRWWFGSDAILTGLDAVNKLEVEASGSDIIYRINGAEVGRVTNSAQLQGDIGLFVETLGIGDVRMQFDNFTIEPLR